MELPRRHGGPSHRGADLGGCRVEPAGSTAALGAEGVAAPTIEPTAPQRTDEVSASTDSSICIGRGNTLVEVKNEPIKVQPNLKISGYQLTVKVANKNAPLPAAQVLLYAATNPQVGHISNELFL